MPQPIFAFGEKRPEFSVPVLNERAVRAAAGLLFLFAMIAFMNAWLTGNFGPTRVFVLAFLVDFIVRLLLNPRFAPSLVMGQWLVRHQQPEWVGAPQKRFAWSIGLVLAVVVTYLVVFKGVVGPLNLLTCLLCLIFLFFETAFGICIGCWIYNRISPQKAQLCPGQACERQQSNPPSLFEAIPLVALLLGLVLLGPHLYGARPAASEAAAGQVESAAAATSTKSVAEQARCVVPEFAKAMGHEEIWKKHNNCL